MADDPFTDERFAKVRREPKFWAPSKRERKVKIDARFGGMFDGKQFKLDSVVDKRGRPEASSTKEQLRKFYDLEEATSEPVKPTLKKDKLVSPEESESSEDEDGEESEVEESSGGEGEDSTDEEEEAEHEQDPFEHRWGEMDRDAPQIDDATRRLAVCNLDWDRVRALDLLVLLHSFAPKGGAVECVSIYPSEYGKERMAEDEAQGPAELRVSGRAEETEEVSRERLRQYQLQRLKYYYAVIDTDSAGTARLIYDELDGQEYQSSSAHMDLRFIPDEMTFEEEPHSVARELPAQGAYKPTMFVTSALNQSAVELTWDETDVTRSAILRGVAEKNEDGYLEKAQQLIAASSDEEEDGIAGVVLPDNEKDRIARYRDLLQLETKKSKDAVDDDIQMEVTWQPGLDTGFGEGSDDDATFGNDQHQLSDDEGLVPVTKKSKKSKKNIKRKGAVPDDNDALELLVMDSEDNKHYNLDELLETKKSKSKKGKKKLKVAVATDSFKINADDTRFSALYSRPDFNVDPSAKEYKETTNMRTLMDTKAEKRKKRKATENNAAEVVTASSTTPAEDQLAGLVKCVRAKSSQLSGKWKAKSRRREEGS